MKDILKNFFNPATSSGVTAWIGTAIVVLGGFIAAASALLGILCDVAAKLGLPTVGCG